MDKQDKHRISKTLLTFVPSTESRAEYSGLNWVVLVTFKITAPYTQVSLNTCRLLTVLEWNFAIYKRSPVLSQINVEFAFMHLLLKHLFDTGLFIRQIANFLESCRNTNLCKITYETDIHFCKGLSERS